jgi:hypothetical protein
MRSRWEALRTGQHQQVSAAPAVQQGAPTVGDGCARVHPLQCAAAAGRSGGVTGLDEVDVLLAAAQSESPKPPWLTGYATFKHRRLDRLTRHFQLGGGCTGVFVAGLRQCTGVRLARLVSFRRQCAVQSRHVWLLWPCQMGRVCRYFLADLSHVFLSCAAVRPAVNCLAAGLVGSHCPRGYPCATGCPGAPSGG